MSISNLYCVQCVIHLQSCHSAKHHPELMSDLCGAQCATHHHTCGPASQIILCRCRTCIIHMIIFILTYCDCCHMQNEHLPGGRQLNSVLVNQAINRVDGKLMLNTKCEVFKEIIQKTEEKFMDQFQAGTHWTKHMMSSVLGTHKASPWIIQAITHPVFKCICNMVSCLLVLIRHHQVRRDSESRFSL